VEGGQRRVRRSGGVELRVRVERRLVVPELEYDQLVRIQGALKDLELLAAGFLLHGAAAVGHRLGLAYVVMTRRTGMLHSFRGARDDDGVVWLSA
jgi:hypothetical protein